MNNRQILEIAMRQSANELGCGAEDFEKSANVVVGREKVQNVRKYIKEPITANLVSYGSNVVASVQKPYAELFSEYLSRFTFYHCFETPNLYWLIERLEKQGQKICFMAEYFLPDTRIIQRGRSEYPIRVLQSADFANFYRPEWSNALCEKRKELDALGAGAYDGDRLVGLAGCSADCEDMWQIGVDVLPEYRKKGIASALTSTLALQILSRGKVPFYCCAWSNIASARNAAVSGFRPAWVEMTVKPSKIVDEMNR